MFARSQSDVGTPGHEVLKSDDAEYGRLSQRLSTITLQLLRHFVTSHRAIERIARSRHAPDEYQMQHLKELGLP